ELIPRFSKIVEKIDRFHGFWQAEEDRLELTETLLERGTINQVEMDGLDLAIFDIDPEQYEEGGVLRGASTFWHDSLHRMALH
ncbi:hypothetical protein ABTD62_21110, partial [Acinetobacter baumannii]